MHVGADVVVHRAACRLDHHLEVRQTLTPLRFWVDGLRRHRASTGQSDGPPLLEVDPDHIKRAVLNLVDNAVEAVAGTGMVTIETEYVAESARVRLTVSDNGPGISSEDRDKLFLPYFSTKVAGMGLGLPIVSEIVNEHGGVIRVEDNQPSGSRFVVEVPVTRAPAPVEA